MISLLGLWEQAGGGVAGTADILDDQVQDQVVFSEASLPLQTATVSL